ncbi:D-tyrosyl-tRNA(Tyr) deacylase [bacterium]|jgi:D-aminoacyl-tRNA deacylase|nr:D-tyrosyl-tRNA(Tyr) deacylase [bacterium]
MKALIQRTSRAEVQTSEGIVGSINGGFLVFLGVESEDSLDDLEYLVHKISKMRVFPDANDKMNLDLSQAGGKILLVSQFTLCADTRKGNRPSFHLAAPPSKGEEYYQAALQRFEELGIEVETGTFGAMMRVSLVNEGPVTIFLDSKDRFRPRQS